MAAECVDEFRIVGIGIIVVSRIAVGFTVIGGIFAFEVRVDFFRDEMRSSPEEAGIGVSGGRRGGFSEAVGGPVQRGVANAHGDELLLVIQQAGFRP